MRILIFILGNKLAIRDLGSPGPPIRRDRHSASILTPRRRGGPAGAGWDSVWAFRPRPDREWSGSCRWRRPSARGAPATRVLRSAPTGPGMARGSPLAGAPLIASRRPRARRGPPRSPGPRGGRRLAAGPVGDAFRRDQRRDAKSSRPAGAARIVEIPNCVDTDRYVPSIIGKARKAELASPAAVVRRRRMVPASVNLADRSSPPPRGRIRPCALMAGDGPARAECAKARPRRPIRFRAACRHHRHRQAADATCHGGRGGLLLAVLEASSPAAAAASRIGGLDVVARGRPASVRCGSVEGAAARALDAGTIRGARAAIEARFSLRGTADRYIALFSELAGGRG